MKNDVLYYSVGALLYCPADQKNIAESVKTERFGKKYSLALCLEDTINDNFVARAERMLAASVQDIYESTQRQSFYLPKIFIRVRNAGQIGRIASSLGGAMKIIAGFIIPKFSAGTAMDYIHEIVRLNEKTGQKIYMMPIYESASILDLRSRMDVLYSLKDILDKVEDLVLNIRVGGNDLCHLFGLRRHADESIHRMMPIANIFADIITVYGMDYVVSGPVWEYYSGDSWDAGLRAEIRDDKLCGFVGKTAIHPKQIPVINNAFKVSRADYEDAQSILHWDTDEDSFVFGSRTQGRMNEYKTHGNWARQTLFLAEAFGIREPPRNTPSYFCTEKAFEFKGFLRTEGMTYY